MKNITKYFQQKFLQNIFRCVRSTLASGTTTACYFATIHSEASLALANICRELGQRAFVGKVCMDRNSPETYKEETAQSLEATRSFVQAQTGPLTPALLCHKNPAQGT